MDESCTIADTEDEFGQESDDLSSGDNQTSVTDENNQSSTNETVLQQNETIWQYTPTDLSKWNCVTYTSHASLQIIFQYPPFKRIYKTFHPQHGVETVSQFEIQFTGNASNFSQAFHHYTIEDTYPVSLRYESELQWEKLLHNVTEDDCWPDSQYNASEKNCVLTMAYSSVNINDEFILLEDGFGNWEFWRYEFVEEILVIGNITPLIFGVSSR